ncbi:hypothetical protein [Erwinia amylovora]|uniref:hypothetical protein n=1 Tax=Erwinia amylovora TaxID=552 RepID=UPI0014449987|nr:hypothetical protein [Erwinia amylovora]
MPNDIKPEITPRFHIHYNLTDNTSAGASRPNVIWLALDISQSSEQLTPQEYQPASCLSPDKIQPANSTAECLSSLALLADTAAEAVKYTKSEVRQRVLPEPLFRPYLHAEDDSSGRKKLRDYLLNKTFKDNYSNEVSKSDKVISSADTNRLGSRQRDITDLLLLRATHPSFISNINNIKSLKNIESFQQRWRKIINRKLHNNQLSSQPLDKKKVWRKIIHELIVSHNKIAPELIPADIFPVQKENEVIQDRISSPEESVKQRLEQHLELALQLELRGITVNHG